MTTQEAMNEKRDQCEIREEAIIPIDPASADGNTPDEATQMMTHGPTQRRRHWQGVFLQRKSSSSR